MSLRAATVLIAAFLSLAPLTSWANLSPYGQNFEGLVQADPSALSNDGWLVFGNVFTPAHVFIYGYGAVAPNGTGAFCAIDTQQGGPLQGAQQLSVYSDYANTVHHTAGDLVESNVYQEQPIVAADIGNGWTFQFDAKRGNLAGATTALAFIKTLNPSANYAITNLITVDMTSIPTTWGTFTLSIPIDASLVGQLLQFGFANTATHFEASGVFYDNVTWLKTSGVDVPGATRPSAFELRAAAPNPFARSTRIEFTMAQRGAAELGVFDVAGRQVATLFRGEAEPGPHVTTWDGRSADGHVAPSGVYRVVLRTAAGRQTRSLVLSR